MKTRLAIILLISTCSLIAEPVWQFVPDMTHIAAIIPADGGLIALSSDGVVQRTSDGMTWEVVTTLGDPGDYRNVQQVIRIPDGWSVEVQGHTATEGELQPTKWYRIYTTMDGVSWDVALELENPNPENGVLLSDPIFFAEKWVIHSADGAPAVIWNSTDGLTWEEVYYSEAERFQNNEYASGDNLLIRFTETSTPKWIQSEDGTTWTDWNSNSPSRIIEANGIFVGQNQAPGSTGILFFSEDGSTWENVANPTGSLIGQKLFYTAGTFIFIQNRDQLHISTNGKDWTQASFPENAVLNPTGPKKSTVHHDNRGFWYKVSETRPPSVEGPPLHADYFFSPDALSWTIADPLDFPEEEVDPVIQSEKNPDYTAMPRPIGNPGQIDPLAEKEIHIENYSLKIERLPEGRQLGLYLKSGAEDYAVVNSSWGSPNADYPYQEPVDIVASNGRFFAINETGRLGVFDPDADYLPQPVNVQASSGNYDDHIAISWDPVPEATTFRILRYKQGDPESTVELAEVEANTFTDVFDLELNAVYIYQVQSLSANRHSWLSHSTSGRLWSMTEDSVFWFELMHDDYMIGQGSWGVGSNSQKYFLPLVDHYPWIWTSSHNWQYCLESPGSLWLWDTQLGWVWTRNQYYPNLFIASEKQWLYFLLKADRTRWFYQYSDESYRAVE